MDNYEHAFDDLLGYEEVKRELKAILCTMGKEKQAAELGAKVPSGLFLYGPPGNGKTAFAKAFMKASLRPSFVLGPSEDYIEKLRQAVEEAAARPLLAFSSTISTRSATKATNRRTSGPSRGFSTRARGGGSISS